MLKSDSIKSALKNVENHGQATLEQGTLGSNLCFFS